MFQVLFVIAPQNFQQIEYGVPRKILEQAGVEITIASSISGEAVGKEGMTVKVDKLISKVKPEDYDAVLFIGGSGMVEYIDNQDFIKLAQDFAQAGKITAAICIAPVILANAGILQGRKATVHSSASNALKSRGAEYTGANVEIDRRIITASGPDAAEEFGKTVFNMLCKKI